LSTRTIIRFKQGKEFVDVYQHGDGYPSWTIPELERFLKWNGIRNDDLSYAVANFVTFGKLETFVHWIDWDKEFKNKKPNAENMRKLFQNGDSNFSALHTGYGIVGQLTDKELNEGEFDMEFYYVVDFPEIDTKDNLRARTENIDIPITVYIPAKDHLKKIGTCTFNTKQGKITKYSKGLLKEVEN